MARYRASVFTFNNYTEDELSSLQQNVHSKLFRYIVWGYEVGDSGTPHLQGYCEFPDRRSFKAVKELLGKRAWFAFRKGTQEQAITYCKKGGKFFEWGTPKKQGRRADLDGVRTLAVESGMRAVVRGGSLQQINVARLYLSYAEEGRDWAPDVTWIYGPSGSGKSRMARRICGAADYGDVWLGLDDTYILAIPQDGAQIWWDGYDGHESVVIDDISPSWLPFKTLLQYLDRYSCRVPNKGGFRQLLPKRIVITSISAPDRTYFDPHGELMRRITHIEKLEGGTEVVGNTGLPPLPSGSPVPSRPQDIIREDLLDSDL